MTSMKDSQVEQIRAECVYCAWRVDDDYRDEDGDRVCGICRARPHSRGPKVYNRRPGVGVDFVWDVARVQERLLESATVKRQLLAEQSGAIASAAELICSAYESPQLGRKVIMFGNGGSATDAAHIVGELVGRFMLEREALPAIALISNPAVVTAIANDFGFDCLFGRQLKGLCNPADVVVGLSTSGKSKNVIAGLKVAQDRGAPTIGLCGAYTDDMDPVCDILISVPSESTPRVQECHITIGHIMCELVEERIVNGRS